MGRTSMKNRLDKVEDGGRWAERGNADEAEKNGGWWRNRASSDKDLTSSMMNAASIVASRAPCQ